VGLFLAEMFPDHVRTYLSIDTVGAPETSPENSAERIYSSYKLLKELSEKTPKVYSTREEAANARVKGISKMFKGDHEISFEACYELTERCCIEKNGKYMFCHDPYLRQPYAFNLSEDAILDTLKKIKCPMEIAKASSGVWTYESLWKRRIELMKSIHPEFQVHYFTGHHHLHLQYPKEIAKIFIDLLKKRNLNLTKSRL
jgi:pimeloyl-ACP methyl ester carboxylesterase